MLTPSDIRARAAPNAERLAQLQKNLDGVLVKGADALVQHNEIVVAIDSIGSPRENELEILREVYSSHWSIAERNDPGDRPFGPQRLWIFRPKG